ncbi:MAG: hypothetical protein H7Y37_13065 [Anaerolineae bacterium]|nr:hypothetical protein [Gloeobacterales cyanobacterium ES-bin-313]
MKAPILLLALLLSFVPMAALAVPYSTKVESIYMDGCQKGGAQSFKTNKLAPNMAKITSYCRCTLNKFEQTMTADEFVKASTASIVKTKNKPVDAASEKSLAKLKALRGQVAAECVGAN